jgi:DNA topoisomerase-1
VIGKDPITDLDILLMKGPYGFYVQLGPTPEDKTIKPKRAAWPKNIPVASADLETALKMLALPRKLGEHPESGKMVEANIGRFGPYVKHDGMFKSIPKAESVHDITLTRAVELLAEKKASGGGGRSLGAHPEDNRSVAVHSGRYGPYVKYGKINATIPASIDPEKITLDEALELLAAKTAKSGKAGKAARPAKPVKSARKEETEKPVKSTKSKAKKKPAAKDGKHKAA